jgi:hypothetical protein
MADDSRDDHAVNAWLQTRLASVDGGRCGWSLGGYGLLGIVPGVPLLHLLLPMTLRQLRLPQRPLRCLGKGWQGDKRR